MNQSDNFYIRRALTLARLGAGRVSPNPMVGAVLVKKDQIIGEGYHQQYGAAHAEINAIESASDSVAGATLYCTLEPCCHYKKQTSPCVPRIIREKIKKVVICSRDPNPLVNGKGIEQLRAAGIEVIENVMDDKQQELNRFYIKYILTARPYVTLKIAQSLDGYISAARNRQTWLTGKRSRRLVHQWRSEHDAVLIGANTLQVDKPVLNVRQVNGNDPIRVILSSSLSIDPKRDYLPSGSGQQTWLLHGGSIDQSRKKQLNTMGINVIALESTSAGRIPLTSVLEYLGNKRISSVLIEGGSQIFTQFIDSNLADQISFLVAPIFLGKGQRALNRRRQYLLKEYYTFETKFLNPDVLITYRKQVDNSIKSDIK